LFMWPPVLPCSVTGIWRASNGFMCASQTLCTAGQQEFSMSAIPVPVITIGLLLISNIFMTFAWYGHLNYKSAPLLMVILVSWGIAFFEYVLMVPANRIGHSHFSAAELKTIQEVITLSVFAVFSVFFLKEPLTWNHFVGFGFIACGAFFIFHKWA
jgi:uncharacterized protein